MKLIVTEEWDGKGLYPQNYVKISIPEEYTVTFVDNQIFISIDGRGLVASGTKHSSSAYVIHSFAGGFLGINGKNFKWDTHGSGVPVISSKLGVIM